MRHILLLAIAIVLSVTSVRVAQTWNPQRAADYLDSRQEAWSTWPRAQSANGPCVSCHTGMTYLVARPVLRRVLGESTPTRFETALLTRLRTNVGAKPAGALRDVEVIFSALFLAMKDAGSASLSDDTHKAFAQLWSLQLQEGELRGAWKWYDADLDPWETPASTYFGASLAALAAGYTPTDYRNRPEVRASVDRLRDYLQSGMSAQPLHNRVALLWASSKLPEVLASSARQSLLDEIFKSQQSDGAWSLKSLGPWKSHDGAPLATGSSAYATSFIAYALQQAGVASTDVRLRHALAWLRSHQDSASGTWAADSMNKGYPAGSMEQSFMRDAATAFAAAALAGTS